MNERDPDRNERRMTTHGASKWRRFYRAAVRAHRGRLKRGAKGQPFDGNQPPREVRRSW